ncbi:acylphosphatase [Terrihabitans soli]|uniref:acylphosphatase n=1 Tax=Terrihabitans soli TaxID=708113 RepID=A0A6S6QT85_9HYPH|nr:acylphosphatase [Terrihabitans soli]
MQGVGYRAWLQREARKRGLKGWVRNRRDGRVEGLLCGPRADIEGMLLLIRRGPPAASVDHVCRRPATEEELALGNGGFSVLRDA